MYKFFRFFNRNRKVIIRSILIIIFILILIQLLNFFTKRKNEDILNNKNKQEDIVSATDMYNSLVSEKSSVTGETINTNKITKDTDVITKFLDYCNIGNIEEAYELISNDCKESMFSTIEYFNSIYYTGVFAGEKKLYTIENWVGDIYKVKITENILSTGNAGEGNTKQDYITVVEEDGERKLNINSYIGKSNINKQKDFEKINVNVLNEEKYMDYTIYNFEVTNNSDTDIALDTLKNIDSMYVQDSSGAKYSAYTHELSQQQLVVKSNSKSQLKIKYYSKYVSTKKIATIVFSKVILDYNRDINYDGWDFYQIYMNI